MAGKKGMTGPNLGGKRPRAGLKPTYRNIEVNEKAAKDLGWFIEDLALDRHDAQLIVSTILSTALREDRDKWANLFGNQLVQKED
jgi:hypothetical protein